MLRYYRPVKRSFGFYLNADDSHIQEWLCELINRETDVYGYRKLTICLQREYDLVINKKKVHRLLDEMEMLQPQRRKQLKHPHKLANNREIKASNELWEMDIKYGYITGEQRFFYLLCVNDELDREVIDFHMGLSCEGKNAAGLIQRPYGSDSFWKLNVCSGMSSATTSKRTRS
ncbi:IS3 family transposase [Paenibacillus sp. LPE1-1-1.1]|uniref:IS3 family transposase n=1 Tax=Paenibacillus sp. LPE1-1-1.1 TaxID=3135230 RepID=UPI003417A938